MIHLPLIYLLSHPCSRVLLDKLTDSQLVKKFPAFYGTRRFVTAFISARHLSLSWARTIQTMTPHSTSWRSILILSIYVLVFQVGCFPRVSPPKPLCNSSLPHTLYMPRPSHSSRFVHPNNIWWGVKITTLLIMSFSPLSCYFVPLRPKYSPQQPILRHTQRTFFSHCERPSFIPIQNNAQNYISVYRNIYIFG